MKRNLRKRPFCCISRGVNSLSSLFLIFIFVFFGLFVQSKKVESDGYSTKSANVYYGFLSPPMPFFVYQNSFGPMSFQTPSFSFFPRLGGGIFPRMRMGITPINIGFNSSALLPVSMTDLLGRSNRSTPVMNIQLGPNNRLTLYDNPFYFLPGSSSLPQMSPVFPFYIQGAGGFPSQPRSSFTADPKRVAAQVPGTIPYFYFENPITCAGGPGVGMCHANKFAQWATSQHARAWTGDFMVNQYYDLARPDGDKDPLVADIKIGCVGCHSPSAYYALGDQLLVTAPPRPAGVENFLNPLPGNKTEADRGIFCDFCHTISAVGTPPVNFNYSNAVTAAIDPKRGPLLPFNLPGVAPHGVIISPLHDDPSICGTCHDEIDPFGQLVKGTYTEWLVSPFAPNTRCQDCHQNLEPPFIGGGPQLYQMNFKGAFTPWIQGVASVVINAPANVGVGLPLAFSVIVTNEQVGHYFPSGSEEERQLWLHVTATDAAGNVWHIPITLAPDLINPANPNHEFWVTTNALVAYPSPNLTIPIARDALFEGDRIYHSIFISPDYTGNKITYAQYYAAQIFSNRLRPLEPREEIYEWVVPPNAVGPLTITAELNFRRMPDSFADFLGIVRRPTWLINSATVVVAIL